MIKFSLISESVNKQNLKSNLYKNLKREIDKYALSCGIEKEDIDYLFHLDINSASDDEALVIEVRAELTYEELEELIDKLDKIIQKYDKNSYFEPVEPGIAEAYLYYNEILTESDIFDEIGEINQEFTSKNTSINSRNLPAIFKLVKFEPETINVDVGGGKFDNVAEYLKDYNVINLVYDPYNRSREHNQQVIKLIRDAGGADTSTCSNVLNVIKEPEARINVIRNCYRFIKPDGIAYFTVYEGDGTGNEGATKAGYQLNRKTVEYVDEISQVFSNVSRKGKLIIAKK